MKKVILFAMLVMASVASVFAQADRIGTRQWKLVQLDGVNVQNSSKAYIELNSDQTRLNGNTGCNRMFGAATVQGRRVDFSNIGTTKMACVEPRVRRVETEFVKALENVDRFRQTANSLELYDRNRMLMRFTATRNNDGPGNNRVGLEDRKWMLEAIKGVPVSKAGRGAFVVFDDNKKSAGGNSNCNVFGGNYSSSGSTINIKQLISTMRACEQGDRMRIEQEFLDGLQKATRFEIERGRLMLYRNQRLLLTLVGEAK